VKILKAMSAWTATLLFMWGPVAQMVGDLNPCTLMKHWSPWPFWLEPGCSLNSEQKIRTKEGEEREVFSCSGLVSVCVYAECIRM
jgi:hypothetical protein